MEKCEKQKNRSFFNMLHIFSCDGCKYKKNDYFFILGRCKISIYYSCRCFVYRKDIENPKPFLLLNFLGQKKLFLVFINEKEYSNNYDLIDCASDYFNEIIILIM